MHYDGLIFEFYYTTGAYPTVYGLFVNNGIINRQPLISNLTSIPTNAFYRVEVITDFSKLIGVTTDWNTLPNDYLQSFCLVYGGKLRGDNKLFRVSYLGGFNSGTVNNSLIFDFNNINSNNKDFTFVIRNATLNSGYFTFSNIGVSSFNCKAINFDITTPAGSSTTTIRIGGRVGSVGPFLAASFTYSTTPSTLLNVSIIAESGQNYISGTNIYLFAPSLYDFFTTGYRVEHVHDVGSSTASNAYWICNSVNVNHGKLID